MNPKLLRTFTLPATVASLTILCASRVLAQEGVDGDLFDNATVTLNSALVECCGSSEANNIFEGPDGVGGVEPTTTIFADAPGIGFTNFIEFSIFSAQFVNSVTLNNRSDNGAEAGSRSTAGFSLFADTDNNGIYETTLVSLTDPLDSGVANVYNFAGVTASSFRAEFTNGTQAGARIIELDAVPEPASFGLLSLGALGLLARRRRA